MNLRKELEDTLDDAGNLFKRYEKAVAVAARISKDLRKAEKKLKKTLERLGVLRPDLDQLYETIDSILQKSKGTDDEEYFENEIVTKFQNQSSGYDKAAEELEGEYAGIAEELAELIKRVEELVARLEEDDRLGHGY